MIVILDENLKKLGVIKNCISSTRREELNGENTLDFEAILDSKLSDLLDEDSIFEVDDDYFDTALFKKIANEDGTYTVEVEAEHISYRLNNPDYDKEYFTEDGTPNYILGKILEGTGFTIDDVDFSKVETYSAQEAKSRRQLLMEFVAYLKGEVKFHKFEVSILQRRGRVGVSPLIKDKDVKVLSKTVNKREKDEEGNPIVSYEIAPINSDGTPYELGDNVRLIQRKLEINEDLRVVAVSYNPYDKQDVVYTFSNYENGLESAIFRINRETLIKDKVYNGIRISPEVGFEAVLSNKLARSYFGADKMAMQVGDGTGENWYDKLYYILDTVAGTAEMYFGGKLTADAISAITADLDFVISDSIITEILSADKGYIAELTVDMLDTSDKVKNYLVDDTSDVNYIKIFDQHVQFITASTTGMYEEQAKNRYSQLLYWKNDDYTMIVTEETDYPVMIYVYNEMIKMEMAFDESGNHVPKIIMGAGTGNTHDSGKTYIYKEANGFYIEYKHSVTGQSSFIKITDDGIDLSMFPKIIQPQEIEGIPKLWVQSEVPTEAQIDDAWIDVDDYTRYDKKEVTENTVLVIADYEMIRASGTITITLHEATTAGIIKKIKNIGNGVITLVGIIDNKTNMNLFPMESVELITNGTSWDIE